MVQRAAMGWRMSARTGPRKEMLGGPAWDYRNIIEKLQVLLMLLFQSLWGLQHFFSKIIKKMMQTNNKTSEVLFVATLKMNTEMKKKKK